MVKFIDQGLEKILFEADDNLENNNYFKALEKYNEALFFLEEEDKPEILFSIADIYSELEDYKEANKVYSQILDINPLASGAWYGLAFTNELLGGDIKESLKSYEKAISIDDSYKEAYYYAATIYGDLNKYNKALEYLQKVIELDPEDFIALNDIGAIYETTKDYLKSKDYLEKSIAINNLYYLSHFNLGVVYKALGDYDKALEKYKEASSFSDSRFIYLNMSAIYIERKEFNKAIEILSEGIVRNPHHILYYNRACSYSKLGDEDMARQDFIAAKNIDEVVVDWAKNDPDLENIIKEFI